MASIRNVHIPAAITEDLAEIIGIHFGDGCMQNGDGSRFKAYKNTYKVAYALDARRPEYIEYVKDLFFKVFHVELRTKDTYRTCVELYFYSKALCIFCNDLLHIPYSPKKNLRIPSYLLEESGLLTRFLRGLFDTDGCYITQHDKGYDYELIRITTKHRIFAEDIKMALAGLGMKSYICRKPTGYDVTIRDKHSYKKFIEQIQPKKKKKSGTRGI